MQPKKYSIHDLKLMNTSCRKDSGIVAITMAMTVGNDYNLGEHTLDDLSTYARQTEDHIWTMGLANAAKHLGFKVKYYSTQKAHNYNGSISKKSKNKYFELLELTLDQKQFGEPTLESILREMPKKGIPIVLLKDEYEELYVVLKGYDSNNVVIVNPYSKPRAAIKTLKKESFTKLWKNAGYESVIIYTGTKPIKKVEKKQQALPRRRKTKRQKITKVSPLEAVDQFLEKLETNSLDRFEDEEPPFASYTYDRTKQKRDRKRLKNKRDSSKT